MKRLAVALAIVAAAAAPAPFLLLVGPRMKVQPHIRTFQEVAPPLPKGVVPFESPDDLPSEQEAVSLRNPLPATPDNLARGKVYYGYYCLFCHGGNGGGDGPVGESYTPRPTDLRSVAAQSRSDGQLLRAMLSGVGHERVLRQVVPAEHRWHIALYVRGLGESASQTAPQPH